MGRRAHRLSAHPGRGCLRAIVAVGDGVDPARIGERVITDNWLRDPDDPLNKDKTGYFGSERDGGFAEYTTIPARNALAIDSPLSDAELATFSCSYSTAEGMLTRAGVSPGRHRARPGRLGRRGRRAGATGQAARRAGDRMASEAKHGDARAGGLAAGPPPAARAGGSARRAGDEKGSPWWPMWSADPSGRILIDILERGGRYTCSGAIAGPMVTLDLRTFYLRDLTFTGSTVIDPEVMPNLVRYIEAGEIRPALAATYPLEELRAAQAAFIEKRHTGNIVVIP
jgi:NADPH:quinone reductase-like Zn-dependent oxidoreductase